MTGQKADSDVQCPALNAMSVSLLPSLKEHNARKHMYEPEAGEES